MRAWRRTDDDRPVNAGPGANHSRLIRPAHDQLAVAAIADSQPARADTRAAATITTTADAEDSMRIRLCGNRHAVGVELAAAQVVLAVATIADGNVISTDEAAGLDKPTAVFANQVECEFVEVNSFAGLNAERRLPRVTDGGIVAEGDLRRAIRE